MYMGHEFLAQATRSLGSPFFGELFFELLKLLNLLVFSNVFALIHQAVDVGDHEATTLFLEKAKPG